MVKDFNIAIVKKGNYAISLSSLIKAILNQKYFIFLGIKKFARFPGSSAGLTLTKAKQLEMAACG